MSHLDPHDYLEIWRQKGAEPPLAQLNLKGAKPSDPVALATFFSIVLSQVLKENDPLWVSNVLHSGVAKYLKKCDQGGMVKSFHSKGKNHVHWFYGVSYGVSFARSTKEVPELALQVLVDYLKENLDEFRRSPPFRFYHHEVASLLERLLSVSVRGEEDFNSSFASNILNQILPLCTDKEKSSFVAKFFEAEGSLENLHIVATLTEKHNIDIPNDGELYNAMILLAVSDTDGLAPKDQQKIIDMLTNKKLRNGALRTILEDRSKLNGSRVSDDFPNIDGFCALLPKEDLSLLTKNLLSSPMRVKDLPSRLQAFYEKEQIQQALRPSPFFNIKKILFSSKPSKTHQNEPVASSRPRKKM